MGSMLRRDAVTAATAALIAIAAAVGVFAGDDGQPTETIASGAAPSVAPSWSTVDGSSPVDATAGSQGSAPSSTGRSPDGAAAASRAAAGIARRPATGRPVLVGINLGDNESTGAQFGVAGLPDVSTQEIDAIVRQVNASGGLAGHPIDPVYHKTDPLDGSFDVQNQETCAAFTEDEHVEIVLANALSPSKVLMHCLADKRVPLVWELHMMQITNAESTSFANYLYRPSMPNVERQGFVIDGLQRSGFFAKGAKVGILRWDLPEFERLSEKVFRPRLRAHGVNVVAEYRIDMPQTSTQAANAAGQASSAVLEFRQKGVTHVLFVPSGGAIPLVFLPAAASQGYYPPYGMASTDAPWFLAQNFPEEQLRDSHVVGWAPLLDGDQDVVRTASYRRCRAALATAKLTWDPYLEPFCDGLYFMQQALRDAPAVSVGSLRSGAERIGSSFESPYVFRTRFGPRHDGPMQARILRYDTSKGHFVYRGAPFGFS